MTKQADFTYEVEHSEISKAQDLDSRGNKLTTIHCHGRLVAGNTDAVQDIFKDTEFRGHIVMDLADVNYIDSAGLGALMRLKLSAISRGGVSVRYINMTLRVKQLLDIANLGPWFSS